MEKPKGISTVVEGMSMQTLSFSKAGGHVENQDAFVEGPHPNAASIHLCAIADGQGGRAGGAEAARLACKTAVERASASSPKQLILPWTWQTIFGVADQAVCDDPDAGFTTLITFCLTESHVIGASNGDSAAILFNSGEKPTILTQNQNKNPPIGAGDARAVSFLSKLVSPWTLLAMTDGVWKYAGMETVLKVGSEKRGEAIIHELRARAQLSSGVFQDDFTVVIFST
jgi:PPM family protein phosphatase